MKILLIRLMGLGDVASILIPAVKLVRQQYPHATTDVMTYAAGIELMHLMPEVNAVLEIKPEQWPNDFQEAIPHFMQIAEVVLAQQYDLVINLDTWFMPCFLARVLKDAGLKVQGNFINQSIEQLFTLMQAGALTQNYFSETTAFIKSSFPNMQDWLKPWWKSFTGESGYPAYYLNHCCGFKNKVEISLDIEADVEFKMRAQGKKIIALSMQGSKISKQYPFQQTLTKFLQRQGYFIWSGFDGSLQMRTTLARLKVTDLLISVPTSTQWLAKLVECPTLMISGPLDPKILGAEITVKKTEKCQYCCQTKCGENLNFACMAVAPQDVLFKVEDFFETKVLEA
jgi:ADP-heptose:LPS heptosyltransferase